MQLSNLAASPHSMQQSYADLSHSHSKGPRRVRIPLAFTATRIRGELTASCVKVPRFEGVAVQIETVTEYSSQYALPRKVRTARLIGGDGMADTAGFARASAAKKWALSRNNR